MRVEILGSAQDGGVPHLGCMCGACEAAREDPGKQRYASSIKVFDAEKEVNYLFDASPDIRYQLQGDAFIDSIFLSHGHLGHTPGLLYLGKESMNAEQVPVYCNESAARFIREENYAYRLLVDRNNIALNTFVEGDTIDVMGLTVEPVAVTHWGDMETSAFMIHAADRSLFYMTDIDGWTDKALERVREADIAVIDGSFWSREEIGRYERVPHPPIKESLERLEGVGTDVYFIHLNHTNPVLDPDSEERARVEDAGFTVAREGMEIEL